MTFVKSIGADEKSKKHTKNHTIIIIGSIILAVIIAVYISFGAYIQARIAYKNSDYEKVVSILGEEEPTEKTEEMLYVSLAQIAYANGDYASVIEHLSKLEYGEKMALYEDAYNQIHNNQ